MFIEQPSKWLRWLYPKALWRMDENEHSVYLTFDDGPIPESTPYILKTLRDFDIKATFFVVGDNVRKYPELYRQILEEGHQVGNHTFNHVGSARHTIRFFERNVDKCFRIMEENGLSCSGAEGRMKETGRKPLFRPPHGWMRPTQYLRYKNKMRIVMWDLVTRDYSKLLSPYDVVRNVKNYVRNGSIITFHDSLKSIDKLYFALPASLRYLKSQGYEFRTFD
ncbi:MAG: polysaccharide deacetylase family protein [Bacteroidales bacterium]|nr:polysaccharide deacetylase family protein [Bacteroidales bacterium]MCM1147703.1 polysaccharide deacetylase family protein [Bacteroidales bacterium]MCM1206768.1 polysaccharide deacetylase family protein [Bacillota bacterium]MCM1510668.1 polysaccharide deacetylase family protein [Clostridium sp.]